MGNCAGVPKENDPELMQMQNLHLDKLTLRKYGSSDSSSTPLKGLHLKFKEMKDRELKSSIFLEVQFHTKVPSKSEYDLDYKI
jgi:hypothetical protein